MNDDPISIPIVRYIAIDAHKHYVMVGGLIARRMQEAGVKVRLMCCPVLIPGLPRNGMVHGFLSTIGLIKRARQYFEQAAGAIRKMVGV
jgi:hypothetical protein